MKVVDAETGKPFRLKMDDEVQAELTRHDRSRACEHRALEVRRAVVAGGQVQYRSQCVECGEPVGTAIAHSKAPSNAPEFDHALLDQRRKAHEEQYEAIIQKHVRLQKAKESKFWKKYKVYLASPEWKSKRERVLKRANRLCEGCLERQATQVHHLTYKHWSEEFLFELVAVCDPCHERLHAGETDDAVPQAGGVMVGDTDDETIYEAPCCACRYQDARGYEWWCGKFDLAASEAMAPDGPCGPRQAELEPLR